MKENNVKDFFSNPGIFVKNVENLPRNSGGKKALRDVVSLLHCQLPLGTAWDASRKVGPRSGNSRQGHVWEFAAFFFGHKGEEGTSPHACVGTGDRSRQAVLWLLLITEQNSPKR